MTETEQLRKELNELRERVAVLESQARKLASPPAGPAAGLGRVLQAGISDRSKTLWEDPVRYLQEQAERDRQRRQKWGGIGTPLRDDRLQCGIANPAVVLGSAKE